MADDKMESTSKKSEEVIASFDRFYINYTDLKRAWELHPNIVEKHYGSILKERDEYIEKIKTYSSENERLVTVNDKLQTCLKVMHEMMGNYHEMVAEINSLKDTNTALKEKCCVLEQEMKTREKQYQEQLQEQTKDSEEKLTLLLQARTKDAENERHRLSGQLELKDRDIAQLKETLDSARKDKENEITVLSMEYENKLAKVKRQKSQALQNAQQTTNQEIFRKKLSHMKQMHEEEMGKLRQQIAQLQQCQAASRPPHPPPPQPVVSPSPRPSSHFSSSSVFAIRTKRK